MISYQGNGDLAYPAMGLNFSGLYTGNSAADFLIGRPQSFNVTTTIIDNGTSTIVQPFFQDNYKLTKRLTVDLGLRWAYQTPWTQKRGNVSTFTYTPGAQSTVYPTAPPQLVVPGDKGVLDGLYRGWKWGAEPRLGFAWDIFGDGSTSLRGAWGLFHAAINEEVEAIQTNNEPFLVSFSTTPPTTKNPWAGQTDPLPYNPKNPSFGPSRASRNRISTRITVRLISNSSTSIFNTGLVLTSSRKLPMSGPSRTTFTTHETSTLLSTTPDRPKTMRSRDVQSSRSTTAVCPGCSPTRIRIITRSR